MLTSVFLLFIVVYGVEYLQILHEMDQMMIDLNIPQWVPMLVLPIAFLGASYRAGEKIMQVAKTPADRVVLNAEAELVHDSVVKN